MKVERTGKPLRMCSHCNGTGTEVDHVSLGLEMAQLRQGAKFTLAQLGRKMGFSISYLSDLEHGRKRWSDEMIENYRKACR